jgi:hypothetical protein
MKFEPIVWVCDECKEPIEGSKGVVLCEYAEMDRYRVENEAWEEKHKDDIFVDLMDPDLPRAAPWRVLCDEHGAIELSERAYWIATERLQTFRALADFLAHMGGKNWIEETDLYIWVYRVEGLGGAC